MVNTRLCLVPANMEVPEATVPSSQKANNLPNLNVFDVTINLAE
ncbi:MAG: hypothetical protein R3E89_15245 [Thiolinea sp.]